MSNMMKNLLVISLFIFSAQAAFAQTPAPTTAPKPKEEEEQVVDIDLEQLCGDLLKENVKEKYGLLPTPRLDDAKNVNCPDCEKKSTPPTPTDDEKISKLINGFGTMGDTKKPDDENLKLSCDAVKKWKENGSFKPFGLRTTDPNGKKWLFTFGFGYTRTWYGKSDVDINSARYKLKIYDLKWKERHCFDWFKPTKLAKEKNKLGFIDEPTSLIFANVEHDKLVVMFSLLHYKYLIQPQNAHMQGTIDGVYVDKVQPIREQFDGYNNKPGESHIWRFESTYWQVNPQIGLGVKLNLTKPSRKTQLTLTPYVQGGIMVGNTYTAVMQKDNYWESDSNQQHFKYQGTTVTAGAKLEYGGKRWGVFLDSKITRADVKTDFLDGTAKYKMTYIPTTLGVTIKFNNTEAKNAIKKTKNVFKKKKKGTTL